MGPLHTIARLAVAFGRRWIVVGWAAMGAVVGLMAYGAGYWVNTKTTNSHDGAVVVLSMLGVPWVGWTIGGIWHWEEKRKKPLSQREARRERIARMERELGVE